MAFSQDITTIGRIDQYRRCSNPRASDILYFHFENMTWTDENEKSVIKAFEHQFKDVTLEAFRVLEQTYADVQWRLVIEALFGDENERRQMLYQQNDDSHGDGARGCITFRGPGDENDKENNVAVVFMYKQGEEDGANKTILQAQVLPALPEDTQYTRYMFHSLPLDVPDHARNVIRQAIIERQKMAIDTDRNADPISLLQSVEEAFTSTLPIITDADEERLENCIMDICIETKPSQYGDGSRFYYPGNMCIVLKDPVTLYDTRTFQSYLVMYGNKMYYASSYSAHYLYCQRCQAIDLHCTDDCPA